MGRVVDELDRSINLTGSVTRLVSLVPNISELVHVFGRAADLVGVTDFCVEPTDGFPHAHRLRGTKNPDVNAIIALKPDLVLANDEENRKYDIERLDAAGVAVYVTRVRTLDDVANTIENLASLLETRPDGVFIAEAIRAIAPAEPEGKRRRVFCPIWRDGDHRGEQETWWCVGPDTYAGQLLMDAGFDLVTSATDTRYPKLSLHEVFIQQPDLVLLANEPYNFTDVEAALFTSWPNTTVLPYAGTDLFWWGARTPSARLALHTLTR